jgi:hypothetical protein
LYEREEEKRSLVGPLKKRVEKWTPAIMGIDEG